MTEVGRVEGLLGLVTLAFTCGLQVRVWRHAVRTIEIKKRG